MNALGVAAPLVLLAMPLPLLVAWLRPLPGQRAGGLRIPSSLRDAMPSGSLEGARGGRPVVLAWVAWIALIVAIAGPRTMQQSPALPASGRDVMLALDLSGSMITRDFARDGHPASRLDILKDVGSDLVRHLAGDRVGLVVFADHAFAAAPLSFDIASVESALREMEIGLVGRSTAIGDGLGLALKRLGQSHAPSRIIVLLSDGANDAGAANPVAVARLAHAMGVRLYTIGLGVHDTENPEGDPDPVDFVALQRLAQIGGGQALRARTTEELASAASIIEGLLAGDTPAPPAIAWHEWWPFPAGIAAIAAALATGALALPRRTPRPARA